MAQAPHHAAGPGAGRLQRAGRSRPPCVGQVGNGRAASIWADRLSSVASSSVRPTSWMAVGSPSGAMPHGTAAAGLPATFHSAA